MKYLLKSSEFTYDAATKKFSMALSEKLHTNKAITLANVAFQLRTDMISPHCLLLCSNLAVLSTQSVYKSAGSNHYDDILALLHENNSGRFVLRTRLRIHIENKDIDRLEFWVRTGAGELLDLQMGGAQPGLVPAVSKEEVLEIAELRLFLSQDANQNSAYETKNEIGDAVRYLINEKSGESYMFSGYQDFQIVTWGQYKGVQSDASWNYQIDSTSPNALATSDFTIVFGVKTCAQTNTAIDKIFNFGFCRLRFTYGSITVLGHPTNDFVNVPNITLLPARDYIISLVQGTDDDADGVRQYIVKAIDLTDLSEMTGTVDAWSSAGNTPTNTFAWWFSDASQHFMSTSGVLAPFILMEGSGSSNENKAINWIKGVYNDGVPVEAGGNSSTFAIEVDV